MSAVIEPRLPDYAPPATARTAWTINDGKIGDAVQCRAIAGALGFTTQHRVVSPRAPWVWFSPWGPVDPKDDPRNQGSVIAPPYPDLVIASGRRAAPYARAVKSLSGGRTRIVMLKDPRVGRKAFDLIWAPDHDELSGPNIFSTLTAPHGLGPELVRLRDAADSAIKDLSRPFLAVLLGGVAAGVAFDISFARRLATKIDKLGGDYASVVVAPSRRTPDAITTFFETYAFESPVRVARADDIPYIDLLAYADCLIVTGDSHNIVSEAVSTGACVYTVRPPGLRDKMHAFIDGLEVLGAVRPLEDTAEIYQSNLIDSTDDIAAEILKRFFD